MKKRILSFILLLSIILLCMPVTTVTAAEIASGICGDNLVWNLDSDGVLTISGDGKMYDWDAYEIESVLPPWHEHSALIQQIIITHGATDIGDCAFINCENVTSISIPDSVVSVGSYAFDSCKKLSCIVLPEGLTLIGHGAFVRCTDLSSIIIPRNVTDIFGSAFNGCTKLTEVFFVGHAPDFFETTMFSGVVAVCYYPAEDESWVRFEKGNYGGTLVWFPKTEEITSGICGSKVTWVLEIDGKLSISGSGAMDEMDSLAEAPWSQYKDQIKSVVIGPGITHIGSNAFSDCKNLEHVYFTNNAPNFGNNVFSNVKAKCYYPSSNTSWEESVKLDYGGNLDWVAFTHLGVCGDNVSWVLDENSELTIFGNGAMTNWDGGDDFYAPWYASSVESVVIDRGVTSIGHSAFTQQTALESILLSQSITSIGIGAFEYSGLCSVTIPNSVTSIGENAFMYCTKLNSVILSDNLTSVSSSLFENCTNLNDITIPDGVTTIGAYAFYGSKSLKKIKLPDNLISIGNDAFSSSGLQEITFEGSAPAFGDDTFGGVTATCYYPDNDISWVPCLNNNYGGTLTWEPYTGMPTDDIGEGLTWSLRDGTLTVSGNGSMKDFEDYSEVPWYNNREAIESVVVQDGITSIGNKAFWDCPNLSRVTICDGVTRIGEYAFAYCSKLMDITIPSSVTTIGDFAFSNTGENATIEISDLAAWCQIKWGGVNAFPYAWNLSIHGELATEITIPASISTIVDYAFWDNESLTDVTIPGNIVSIGCNSFYSCQKLTNITILEGVCSIGSNAFSGCSSLSNVTLPQSIEFIGSYAFSDCGFETILLPSELETIEQGTFRYCRNLKSISFGSHVTAISHYAFSNCAQLTSLSFTGDMPAISDLTFMEVTAKACYPCDKNGWDSYKLLNYGGMLTWEKVHRGYNSNTVEPTCIDDGYTIHTCACGDSYADNIMSALGHNYIDGICTVCGEADVVYLVRNMTTGTEYTTLTGALDAAQEGESVQMLADSVESRLMITPGVTLDLNGKMLTADYVVAFDTAHIIDSAQTGRLNISSKNLVLDEENAMVPVYDAMGYTFTKVGFAIRQDEGYTGDGMKINALAYPVNMDIVELLKDGSADNDIQVMIRLNWDTADGTGSQEFVFTDAVVGDVYSSNNGTWNSYSKMFSMVITGFENINNLRANMVIVSGTNVQYVSSTSISIT